MRYLLALFAAAALAVPTLAAGGGWATVGIEPLPDGTVAGDTWNTTIFIKQHGVRPLSGLRPTVTISNDSTGASRTFTARETSEAGAYRAEVVFPTAGEYRLEVDSTFGESRLTYGPFTVVAPVVVPGGASFPTATVAAVVALLAVAFAALFGARRLRRLRPASG